MEEAGLDSPLQQSDGLLNMDELEEDEDEQDSLNNFAHQADDEFDSSEEDHDLNGGGSHNKMGIGLGGKKGGHHNSLKELVPVEFAKAHIMKIEEDMKNMHERHVKLMREMDQNYKMIE